VEAYLDVADNYVEIITQWPGISAEQVEQQVTIPLEIVMNGIPHVTHLRSFSLFGLSDLKLIFDDEEENNNCSLSQASAPEASLSGWPWNNTKTCFDFGFPRSVARRPWQILFLAGKSAQSDVALIALDATAKLPVRKGASSAKRRCGLHWPSASTRSAAARAHAKTALAIATRVTLRRITKCD